jgi:hypothetical protein
LAGTDAAALIIAALGTWRRLALDVYSDGLRFKFNRFKSRSFKSGSGLNSGRLRSEPWRLLC